jgi:putative transposase
LSVTYRWAAFRVACELDAIIAVAWRPAARVSDNGTELADAAIQPWWQTRRIDWRHIAPWKPQQNAFAESFIGLLREWLNETLFSSISHVRKALIECEERLQQRRPT